MAPNNKFSYYWENPAGDSYLAQFGGTGRFVSNAYNAAGTATTGIYQDEYGTTLQASSGNSFSKLHVYGNNVQVEGPLNLSGKINYYNGVPVAANDMLLGASGGYGKVTPQVFAAALPVLNNQHPVSTGGTPSIQDITPSGTLSNVSITGTDASLTVTFTLNPGYQLPSDNAFFIGYSSQWAAAPKAVAGFNDVGQNTTDNLRVFCKSITASTITVYLSVLSPGTYTFTILSMQ